MYNDSGTEVWSCHLNSYGKVRKFEGEYKTDCPFRYQGQYEDSETGLYYNRFRYYSPDEGMYISQDPIRLKGGQLNIYSYVFNPNKSVDTLGLQEGGTYRETRDSKTSEGAGGQVHHIPAKSTYGDGVNDKGPAIWMETSDHQQTASHGWQGNDGKEYRRQQEALINSGKFGEAMEMDIRDLHNNSNIGHKYDEGLIHAINEAQNQGLIDEAEADRLKSMCNAT